VLAWNEGCCVRQKCGTNPGLNGLHSLVCLPGSLSLSAPTCPTCSRLCNLVVWSMVTTWYRRCREAGCDSVAVCCCYCRTRSAPFTLGCMADPLLSLYRQGRGLCATPFLSCCLSACSRRADFVRYWSYGVLQAWRRLCGSWRSALPGAGRRFSWGVAFMHVYVYGRPPRRATAWMRVNVPGDANY